MTIGQPGPGPWAMVFRFRSFVDARPGQDGARKETLRPMVEQAEEAGRRWWGALLLSALAFVEFAAGDHRAVDETLTRMRAHLDALGTLDMVPDRSEPFHVESLLALGEPERARAVLERLEERGRTYPRLWITATLPRTRALLLADEGEVGPHSPSSTRSTATRRRSCRSTSAGRCWSAAASNAGPGGGVRPQTRSPRLSRSSSGSARPAGRSRPGRSSSVSACAGRPTS